MNDNNRLEQHYAVSTNGVLTHIKDAHDLGIDCFCPFCGGHMLNKCGNIRQWHFAHDFRDTRHQKCSYESYLHSFAKLRIKEWFEKSNSIFLHYQKVCRCKSFDNCTLINNDSCSCKKASEEIVDLKKSFDKCELEKEKQINGSLYRPDLLWLDSNASNKFLFVEIKVSHGCTEQKKQSTARIIEFEIHTEEDVNRIVSTEHIIENDITKFYGFKTEVIDEDGLILPEFNMMKFILYKSGKPFVKKEISCQDYKNRHKSSIFEMTIIDDEIDCGHFYNCGLAAATNAGYSIKNCHLCNNKKFNEEDNCAICAKTNNIINKACDATTCEYFQFSKNSYNKYYSDFLMHSEFWEIDIWSQQK